MQLKSRLFIPFVLLLGLTLGCAQEEQRMTTAQAHQKMEDLYKTVQFNTKADQILYSLKVFNGVCNYKIWVNDMPVFNMYEGARGELSFSINGKILKSGAQELKVRIYPYWNREAQKWEDHLHKYAGLDVDIEEMDWNESTRKWEFTPVLSYQTPREGDESLQEKPRGFLFEEGKEDLPYYEETLTFQASVPYHLKGWSESVNLKQENQDALFKEVEAYYLELIKNFEEQDIPAIAQKYYTKEKEIAQALFLKKKESKSRWHEDFLSRAAHSTAKGDDLKDPYLSFSGNGRVISLLSRPGGTKALQMIRDKENGKKGYATVEVYLHRPKPGTPLEMIR